MTTGLSDPPDLAGSVVLITGGASGIGQACARRCAARGASVLIADVNERAARAVAAELTGSGSPVSAVTGDVGDERVIASAVAAASALGPLTGLVAAAGIGIRARLHEIELDDWETVLRVNLTGTFLAVKHGVREMLRHGQGSIVTIGSTAALVADGSSATYAASKGGVLQFTRYVAAEYAADGIRANCLCPGLVSTAFRANTQAYTGRVLPRPSGPRPKAPIERSADPAEVAEVAAFLLSARASFITGAAVAADGGYTAV